MNLALFNFPDFFTLQSSMNEYASKLSSMPEDLRRVETELAATKSLLMECRRELSLRDAALEQSAAERRDAVMEREKKIEEMKEREELKALYKMSISGVIAREACS